MSENSLEVVASNASEPVVDVKQTEEVVETTEVTEEAPAEPETEEVKTDAEPEKKLTKAEEVKQEYESKLAKEREQFQKRIDRKTAAEKQALENLQQLQKQVEEMQRANPQTDNAPREEDFDSWEDYNKAVVVHRANEMMQAKLLQQKEAELAEVQKRQLEQLQKDFQTKEHAFREKHPEYDENFKLFMEQANYLSQRHPNNEALMHSERMLFSSEVAPALINELAINPDFAEDLATMTPEQAVREIVKLEMKFTNVPETKVEQPLPTPAKSLKGNAKPSKSLDSMSAKELMGWVKG